MILLLSIIINDKKIPRRLVLDKLELTVILIYQYGY